MFQQDVQIEKSLSDWKYWLKHVECLNIPALNDIVDTIIQNPWILVGFITLFVLIWKFSKTSTISMIKPKQISEPVKKSGFECDEDNVCKMIPSDKKDQTHLDRILARFTPAEINFMEDYPEIKPYMKSPIEFDDFQREVQVGDILVVRGHMPFSILIQHVQDFFRGTEPITHVGLFMDQNVLVNPNPSQNDVLVVESGISGIATDSVRDINGNAIDGVQLRWLKPQMLAKENTNSIFGWLRLAPKYRQMISQKQKDGHVPFRDALAKYIGYPYPAHAPQKFVPGLFIDMPLVASALENMFDDENLIFCSHLLTLMFQQEGLIDASIDANRIFPVDIMCCNKTFPRVWDQFRIIKKPVV